MRVATASNGRGEAHGQVMAYTALDLAGRPLILCGPLLRRVDRASVTVWVALKERRSVKLTVHDAEGRSFSSERIDTRPAGEHLFVAAATARGPPALLAPGRILTYDLEFNPGERLDTAGVFGGDASSLCYKGYRLPSFTPPADDWTRLRFFHGSCRKPHGEGQDALPAIDVAIERSVRAQGDRPQLLLLTGDQIYADDVADALLFVLEDVGHAVVGGGEEIPSIPPEHLRPGRRGAPLAKIGITAGEDVSRSHLARFREWCAMYLLAWSDVLWPPARGYPDVEQVFPGDQRAADGSDSQLTVKERARFTSERARFTSELRALRSFQASLPTVRRVLANVPTLMILDDHEVTDDWFLSRKWCETVLGNRAGRRIVRNALAAYALFQAWGNTPEQFVEGTAGGRLVHALAGAAADEKSVEEVLGIPPLGGIGEQGAGRPWTLARPRRDGRPDDGRFLRWDYALEFETYQIAVLDTRTWRAYPGPAHYPPSLLSDEAFERQLSSRVPQLGASSPEGALTIVVTPAVPLAVPLIEWRQQTRFESEILDLDTEGWTAHPGTFQRLLAHLATRDLGVASEAAPLRKRRVVVLSGDVHHSYSTRVQYWASKPFGRPQVETQSVLALLTSSASRNETDGIFGTVFLHEHGYEALGFMNERDEVRFLGWENRGGAKLEVATITKTPGILTVSLKGSPLVMCLDHYTGPGAEVRLRSAPEWRYRIDYRVQPKPRTAPPSPPPVSISTGDPRACYALATEEHRKYVRVHAGGLEIVGRNNVCEVAFERSGDSPRLRVVHRVWWREEPDADPAPRTAHDVSLEFDDPEFPDPLALAQAAH